MKLKNPVSYQDKVQIRNLGAKEEHAIEGNTDYKKLLQKTTMSLILILVSIPYEKCTMGLLRSIFNSADLQEAYCF